jgi:hypothetical protein
MASISSSAMTEEYERIIQPLKDAPARAAEWLRIPRSSLRIAGGKYWDMPPEKSPGQGTLIVAALIVLGIVFAGHWIVSYVQTTNPWAIIPWYGVAAVLIIVCGNLRRGGG